MLNTLVFSTTFSIQSLAACNKHMLPRYIPPSQLSCTPCPLQKAGWVSHLVQAVIRVVTQQGKCCPEKEEITRKNLQRLESVVNCGRRGRASNQTRRMKKTKGRIVKNGKDPFKIIGGELTFENEIPWQVAILKSDNSWDGCGALLLSCDPIIVITAAHCVQNRQPHQIRLAFGAHHLEGVPSPLDRNEVRMDVAEIVVHPEFRLVGVHARERQPRFFFNGLNLTVVENDLAVLKVKNPETLQCEERKIWPACLPEKGKSYIGEPKALMTGWGKIAEGGPWSRFLRKVRIPVVPDEECDRNVFHYSLGPQNIFSLAPNQICAGDITDRKGPCQGDSGGPLVSPIGNGRWAAVGLVSWRNAADSPGGGCSGDTYTVFTEISEYLGWIASQMELMPPIA